MFYEIVAEQWPCLKKVMHKVKIKIKKRHGQSWLRGQIIIPVALYSGINKVTFVFAIAFFTQRTNSGFFKKCGVYMRSETVEI